MFLSETLVIHFMPISHGTSKGLAKIRYMFILLDGAPSLSAPRSGGGSLRVLNASPFRRLRIRICWMCKAVPFGPDFRFSLGYFDMNV